MNSGGVMSGATFVDVLRSHIKVSRKVRGRVWTSVYVRNVMCNIKDSYHSPLSFSENFAVFQLVVLVLRPTADHDMPAAS